MLSHQRRATGCRLLLLFGVAAGALAVSACSALAQEPGREEAAGDEAAQAAKLATTQDAIELRYERFEKTLLQMAEYMRKTDPARAELLIRVIARSKEDRIAQEMQSVAKLLGSHQLGDAAERQAAVMAHLTNLLKLLQSEDRLSELDKEQQRIEDLLKDLNRVIAREKDVRVATERREAPGRLVERQQKVADEAEQLGEKIDAQDAQRSSEQQPQDGDGRDAESGESQQQDAEQSDMPEGEPQEKQDGEQSEEGEPGEQQPPSEESSPGKPGESKPGESQKPTPGQSQGKPAEQGQDGRSQPSEGESRPGESSQPGDPQQTPGREEIEQAKQELERAIEELKRKRLDEASDHQDEAIAQLQAAKERLEEILRQLREEEKELMLAGLEARFQKMLAQQVIVYEGTTGLAATPQAEWGSRHTGRARELSLQEDEIALEAARTLSLLREEGSSVAFPEALEQLQEDMRTVARRLEQSDAGELTQGIEQDIIESLEELIEALQREMEKKSDEESQPPPPGQGQPQELALVDKLAELKMLRSLQLRVNRRTRLLGGMIADEQATDGDLVRQLQELSTRQARIQEATYDLSVGRNR